MSTWGIADIPDQHGRTFIVTGSNSGIGWEAAAVLAEKGAEVVMACRSAERASAAAQKIAARHPTAKVRIESLDLSNLGSIRAFADRFGQGRLDGLLNNAGLMAIPFGKTADGFEMQFGTNHLGHFALTALLFPRLAATPKSRVVNVSSVMHRFGRLDFSDGWMDQARYSKWGAYNRSKLANLVFTHELARRFAAWGADITVTAAHPGYSATELQGKSATLGRSKLWEVLMAKGNSWFAQSAAMGAMPTLRAATDPEARSGDYFGPSGLFERAGAPKKVACAAHALDAELGGTLWAESEKLTGIGFRS
jgi:NAD(P)-dependent dehydrogenase (short-subunit alcohol dehydrogenase family)